MLEKIIKINSNQSGRDPTTLGEVWLLDHFVTSQKLLPCAPLPSICHHVNSSRAALHWTWSSGPLGGSSQHSSNPSISHCNLLILGETWRLSPTQPAGGDCSLLNRLSFLCCPQRNFLSRVFSWGNNCNKEEGDCMDKNMDGIENGGSTLEEGKACMET